MANIPKCKRCGADVIARPHATNRRFCSRDCYDTWWSDFRRRNFTVADVVAKRDGPPPDVRLNEVQAAWLAALIDGEGTIGIYRMRSPTRTSGYLYRACVQVANTNRKLLARMAELVPSGVHVGDARQPLANHRVCYRATVRSRFIAPLLRAIRPALVAKVEQADTVLAFCEAKASAPFRSSQDASIFETLYQANRLLNQRGRKE